MAELKIISMDEVQSKEVNWPWYPYIPYGKITIIQGDPGEGKTTLALRLAALISKGEARPYDDSEREPVKIIYQTAEDGLEDTIKPRLESAEADCTQIKVIDESAGKKSFTGKYTVSADDYEKLTTLAKQSYLAVSEAKKLQEENRYLTRQIWSLQSEVSRLKTALYELTEKCRPYLEALKTAPKAVKEFIDGILERFKKQEKSIFYEPIPALKTQSQEREKRFRNYKDER